MERGGKGTGSSIPKGLLRSEGLYRYVLDTSVYPLEPELLKELRDVTARHPRARMGTVPDTGQMKAMLLKMINAKRTIEIGVFTGYSLLLTALNIPEDGKYIRDGTTNHQKGRRGQPIIRKAGVEHKIEFIEWEALPILEMLLQKDENEGRLVVYDNTLRRVLVAMPAVLEQERLARVISIEFNRLVASDDRVEICHALLCDGITICRRLR